MINFLLKNPKLDNKLAVEFWKVTAGKTKDFFKKRDIVSSLSQEFLLEKFIISDTLGKLDQYNLEVRGLGLIIT